jgi:hypothetical protein
LRINEKEDLAMVVDRIESEMTQEQVASAAPQHSEIAALAYQLWKDRCFPFGSPDEDWFRAEKELSKGHEIAAATG